MRVFLDTNILIDIVERRPQFFATSQQVLDRCDQLGCVLAVAPHGLATVFYLTRRKLGVVGAAGVICQILAWAEVANTGDSEARRALTYGIADYEDALQAAAAQTWGADCIVSRDVAGFEGCPITVLGPEEFLERYPAIGSSAPETAEGENQR